MAAEHKEEAGGLATRPKPTAEPDVRPPNGEEHSTDVEWKEEPGTSADAGAVTEEESEVAVVDFDALNAALGAIPTVPPPASTPQIPVAPVAPSSDSDGRSSATYASLQPHAIPATRAPADEVNAPAVIVAVDDTVPTGSPAHMTARLSPHGGIPAAAVDPSAPVTPEPFLVAPIPRAGADVNQTVRMDERPRRPRSPTIVVRTRGPSKQQKLLVFMSMLLVFVCGGIAFLIYRPPPGLHLDFRSPQSRAPSVTSAPVATPVTTPAPTTSIVAPSASTVVSAAPPASVPPPPPTGSGKKPRLK